MNWTTNPNGHMRGSKNARYYEKSTADRFHVNKSFYRFLFSSDLVLGLDPTDELFSDYMFAPPQPALAARVESTGTRAPGVSQIVARNSVEKIALRVLEETTGQKIGISMANSMITECNSSRVSIRRAEWRGFTGLDVCGFNEFRMPLTCPVRDGTC